MIDTIRAPKMDLTGTRLRLGAVSYLNSKPLIEGLEGLLLGAARSGYQAELVLDLPSRLADRLARGELDVALIPSVEAFADPEYRIVSDACVATRGPVLSVKCFFRKHPGEITTIAMDEGSRTSAALVRVILEERYGVRPQLRTLPIGSSLEEFTADAVLLIGDRAMHEPVGPFHTIWDLGSEWLSWTGLPFVFAMWIARADTDLGPIERMLGQARDLGCQRLQEIARREAPALRLNEQAACDYLQRHLHFYFGEAEFQGLKLFQELAAKQGLVPAESSLIQARLEASEPVDSLVGVH